MLASRMGTSRIAIPDPVWLITPEQSALADASYARHDGPTWGLMQRAAAAVALSVMQHGARLRVHVICGPGNNGADGLLAAAMLRGKGWSISACRVGELGTSQDARQAAAQYAEAVPLFDGRLEAADLYIDAMFGAGFSRPLEGAAEQVTLLLNTSGKPVIAIDIASGVDGRDGSMPGLAVQASETITFFRAKPGHYLLPGRGCTGRLSIADIGLEPRHLADADVSTALNDPALWQACVPSLEVAHKYERGRLWVLGGAEMTGAAALAAGAGLRAGAGLVGIAAPPAVANVYRSRERALIVSEAPDLGAWDQLLARMRPDALVLGPGLGRDATLLDWLRHGLQAVKRAVLDADALTLCASQDVSVRELACPELVLTPHEGEFARLFPDLAGSKLDRARQAAAATGAVVVLKGPDTIIASPDGRAAINGNAPASLATAGTGDVLAGCIGALLARGMPAFEAACAGVWSHGEAANRAGRAMIADDLLLHIEAP
jgi:ADP-dependent NAD(P)H-hydrate dehydratase / NAD(P)H-hydrate epimerase